MTEAAKPALPAHIGVAIIGAGFGGLSAAIDLQRAGQSDFLVIERAPEVGGTWRDNTYPGCACDIPSQLYSFSHTPNPHWSRSFPSQPEIQAYVLHVVHTHRLRPRIACDTLVESMAFDGRLWHLELRQNGQLHAMTAQFVVAALGPLNKPNIPAFDGQNQFTGQQFHSMNWRHDIDLTDKKIAVVGTGPSAIQFIPEIVKTAAHVTVFQRSATWVMPRRDAAFGPLRRALMAHVPGLQRLHRWLIYGLNEFVTLNFLGATWVQGLVRWAARHHLKRAVPNATLRAQLTPTHPPGCKRLGVSDDYLPALSHAKVQVITSPIAKVGTHNLVCADGQTADADVIIYGTGFKVTEFVRPLVVRSNGQELGQLWATQKAASWRGLMVHGFPNLFLVVGPNTGLGSNSIIFMIEAQTRAMAKIVAKTPAGHTVQPQLIAQNKWYAHVQLRMKKTVWVSGCSSYYQSADGHIDTLWPDFTWRYWLQMRRIDWRELEINRGTG